MSFSIKKITENIVHYRKLIEEKLSVINSLGDEALLIDSRIKQKQREVISLQESVEYYLIQLELAVEKINVLK